MILNRKVIPFNVQHKGEGAILFAGIVFVSKHAF